MKVLYITSKPPFPVIDGGCFASAQFLRTLIKAGYDVRHFTISTEKHPFEPDEYPAKITKKVKPLTAFINTKVKPVKAVKGILTEGSYNVDRFFSSEALEMILKLVEDNPEVIILDSLYSSPYLNALREHSNAKILMRSHNVEYLIWEELAAHTSSIAKRTILRKLAKDLRSYELNIANQFDGILTITAEDKSSLKELGVTVDMTVIPIPVEVPKQTSDYTVSDLFHIGSMNWEPNVEAVDILVGLLPQIRQKLPDIRIHLAGGGLNGSYERIDPEVITEDGFVDDVYAYAAERGILVSPIQSGSGVRVKILEMMALGAPIITTQKGAQGISDQSVLRIANSKEELSESIIELATNEELRKQLGSRSRIHIENYHDIGVVSEQLIHAIGE